MKYVEINNVMEIQEYSTSTSTSFGHFAAEGVFTVGATPYYTTPAFDGDAAVLNSYSSRGRQEILFDPSGNRLAQPEVRHNSHVTAPDQVDTSFFIGGDVEPNGLPNFAGTSAAAPHVAAVAALMLEAAGGPGSLSVKSLYTALENTAIDILQRNVDAPVNFAGGLGYDYYSGHGLVDALAAVTGALNGFDLVFDANYVAGDPNVNDGNPADDGLADTYTLSLDGSEVVVTINGIEAGRMNLAALNSLTFVGSGDDDLLIVDLTNGNPIPAGGLEFQGGGSTVTGDRLRYVGGSPTEMIHAMTAADAGNTTIDASLVSFTGVELVADLTSPVERAIALLAGTHAVTLSDGDAAADGVIRLLTSGTSPVIDFNNPTLQTLLTTGPGNDELQIEALDSLATSPLVITLGGGNDLVSVLPQVATPISLDGGPHTTGDTLFVNALDAGVTDTGSQLQFVGFQSIDYSNFEQVSISNAGGGGGLPDISVEAVSQAEGSGVGVTDFVFTVTLSAANLNHSVFVDFFTSNDTAEDESGSGDYLFAEGTLEFAPGVTQRTVTVHVQRDETVETNEQFFLNLANAINANLLVEQTFGVIVNDDFDGVDVVYVNQDWLGTPLGDDPDGAGPALNFGSDSFADFPDAVAGITAGGTILMYAGDYQGA
jgi:hypothetical protein